MKKLFITLAAVALFGLNSCKNCGQCKFATVAVGEKYCKADGEDAYNEAKEECQSLPGYTWSTS